jgi:radical SAM protein with 4Fe4S-binding SPASM domain
MKKFESVQKWLPKNEASSMYDYSNKIKKKTKVKECSWLWTQATINWNGSVSTCCAVWFEKYDVGNINSVPFRKIWNNRKYQEARQINRGNCINAPDNVCNICYINYSSSENSVLLPIS